MKKIIFLVFLTGTAQATTISYKGVVSLKSPCNEKLLQVHGITTLSINETTEGVIANENFSGVENGYSVNYAGTEKFEKVQDTYEIEIKGTWESSREKFKSNAIDRIQTKNGIVPFSDSFKEIENSCEK